MNEAGLLCGIVARTSRGRTRLRTEPLSSLLPPAFPRTRWWKDGAAGVALLAPRAVSGGSPGRRAALALSGHLLAGSDAASTSAAQLLRALRRRRGDALAALRGEFALALWDGEAGQLLLARDHLGQRGAFVRHDEDFDLFCSELAPLLRDPAFSCELDLESAFHYLASGLPAPGRTLARRIARVPAAHALAWRPGGPWLEERYWTPLGPWPQTFATDEVKAELEARLDGAIAARVESGRSQAVLLSGGIDSSYLAVTIARGAEVDAYTIEFTGGHGESETEHARTVAAACGARHRVVTLDLEAARELLAATLAAAEPCSAWATVTHRRLLAEVKADGHELLWSGLGSDEVFGGYLRFLDSYFLARDHVKRWPHADRIDAFDAILCDERRSRQLLYPGVACFFADRALARSLETRYRSWHYVSHLQEFYRECRRLKPNTHLFEMMIAHECQRRIPDLLFVDFEGVARELGVRTTYPFLDPDVVSRAASLGATSRYWCDGRRWWNKMALRDIARRRLPAPIIERIPASYTAPFADWLRVTELRHWVFARLHRSRLFDLGFLKRAAVTRLEREFRHQPHRRRPSTLVHQLWALLTLTSWYDRYVEGIEDGSD